jgi:hypothetical protein
VGEAHDTPDIPPLRMAKSPGFGVDRFVQVLPSHRSASVPPVPLPLA